MKMFKTFRRQSKKSLLGFDLDEERIKIVLVRVNGRERQVAALVTQEVRGMSDEAVAAFISKTVSDLKLAETPLAFMTAPLGSVITRNMELPSRDDNEIREMLGLQVSRHTPYSRSEIILDTLHLGVRGSYTKVLMVIVPRDTIVRQARILEKAGLRVQKVFFPAEAICEACAKISGGQTLAIVHMDALFTAFMVAHEGKILFLRGIPLGAEHLIEAGAEARGRFEEELRQSLDFYGGEEGAVKPALLVLTGVTGDMTDFDPLFRELNIPIQHQVDHNYFPISPEAKKTAIGSKRVSFFNVIAPLLLFDKMRVDLVSDEQRIQRQVEERGREVLRMGVLAMLLLFLAFTSFAEKTVFKKAYLGYLQTQYKPVLDGARELETLFSKNQAVKNHLASRGRALQSLLVLYEALPVEVSVSEIRYDEGQRFSVRGSSPSMALVFSLVSSLEKSEDFKDVKTKHVTSRNEGAEAVDFEVSATMKGGMDSGS